MPIVNTSRTYTKNVEVLQKSNTEVELKIANNEITDLKSFYTDLNNDY